MVKAKLTLMLCGLSLLTALHAQQPVYQLSDGGTPWAYKFTQYDSEVPIMDMGIVDVNALNAEDAVNDLQKDNAWRFGYNHFVSHNLNNSGAWKTLDNGDKIWRIGYTCPGAITINLAFQYLSMPSEAKLFIYNEDKTITLGAFTQQYVSPDLQFGTELIPGETVFVEYYVPASAPNVGSLEIFRVTHGYRSTTPYVERAFGSSGACENNARCFPAYDNNIRSVVMLVSGGAGFCTGALINNTCNDGTPYVLTANHCGSATGSWVFRFNWEAPTCTQPGSSPSFVSLTGGTARASNSGSDMHLCQINTAIPAGYAAYFSGWDRNNTAATNPYGIHHPAGDIKKISFTTGTAISIASIDVGNGPATCWQTPTWTDGVTEGGSSGSPLFNSSGQIIGQLYGGPSNCGCEGNAGCGYDYYGKLYTSWTGGGTNATRLSNWLAPAGCGAAPTTLVGYDPNTPSLAYDAQVQTITSPSGTLCTGSHLPVITIRNNGTTTLTSMTINYQIDGGAATPYAWSGSLATGASTNVTMPSITIAAGAHTYTATIVTASLNGAQSDQNTANNALTSNYTGTGGVGVSLPFTEGFENVTFPPTNWTNENPNNNVGSALWVRTTTASGYGGSTASALIDQFSPGATTAGQLDNLITPSLNLTTQGTPINLTFSVANARYNATLYDSLIVWISTTCGATWTRLASYGNNSGPNQLTTAPDITSLFDPTNAQWATKTISLNSYASQTSAQIRFQLRSGWGNATYIDDVNISGAPLAPPVASFTLSDNTICAGQTVTYTNTSSGATSFNWTFPGGAPGLGSTSPINVTYVTPGTYTTTLTATNINGSNTSTQTITVSANPTNTASNGGPYCAGATIQLNATAGATDYDWIGPNSYAQNNMQNPSFGPSTTLMGGVYTVTVTNAAGCTATASTTVTVNAIPTANATNGGPYCVGTTIQLNSVGGSATDDWAGPSYAQNNVQNPTISGATLGMAGAYTVTVTGAGGCTSTSSTTVVVNANPTANATNGGPYCSGASIQLNSVGGSATDDWSGPNSYSQNDLQNPSIPSSTVAMGGTYTVTVTNGSGCTATATTSVVVNATPAAAASNTGPYCPGTTIQLNSSGGSGYSWVGPSSFSDGTQNPTIPSCTVANDGVYTVTVTSGSCSSTATTIVTVANTSSATANNTGAYCEGETIDLNTIAGGTNYAWTGPNSFSASIQNPTIPSSTLAMNGVYDVTVTFVGGCTSSATTTVVVNPNPSAPVITPSGATTFCSGNSVTLTSSYPSGNTWSTTETTATINVVSSGTYVVTYTDGNGCTNTASQLVTVNSLPSVSQTPLGTVCVTYAPIILTGGSPAGGTYSGTAVSGGQFDPTLAGVGTFNITYTYTDGNGCTNNTVASIDVLPCSGIEGSKEEEIIVYPNPTDQYIYIAGLENGIHDYSITNTLGQVIRVGKLSGDGIIDLGIVATGTYYLKVDNRYWKIIKK